MKQTRTIHWPALDGVRGLAVLGVFLFHFGQWSAVYGDTAAPGWLRWLNPGQMGVDLFFVLSGFLITGILVRNRGQRGYFRNFYARRCLRIFPLYYAYLAFFFVIGAAWRIPDFMWGEMWWYLPFLQNFASTFAPERLGGPHHFWSLAVEEHFYLVWPLVVSIFPAPQLRIICAGLVATAFLVRCGFLMAGLDVFTFTLCRMDSLAIGAWLALLHKDGPRWSRIRGGVMSGWWAGLALLVAAYATVSGSQHVFLQATKYTLTALAAAGLLVLVVEKEPTHLIPRFFSMAWLRGLGRISYGFYVFHPYPMQRLTGLFFKEEWSPWHGRAGPAMLADLLFLFALTLAISLASWKFLEQPFLRLKKSFV